MNGFVVEWTKDGWCVSEVKNGLRVDVYGPFPNEEGALDWLDAWLARAKGKVAR